MTSRTQAQYTRSQILERCICITVHDFLSRGANARNPRFKHLDTLVNLVTSNDYGAHLLEWPDGTLVLVISRGAREFSQLSPRKITAAYRRALDGSELIYRDY